MTPILRALWRYHCATKHRPERYAPSPGFLDWDDRPDPFRRFLGARTIPLPLPERLSDAAVPYDELFPHAAEPAGRTSGMADAPLTTRRLGLFQELAFGLSGWKVLGPDRWSLRNTPSSGNLHPTETYVIVWSSALSSAEDSQTAVPPGVYHYAADDHVLECRQSFDADMAEALSYAAGRGAWGAIGFSSILWREAWKYGGRSLRYCLHDVGHALAAARMAAGAVGWSMRMERSVSAQDLATILGLDRSGDFTATTPDAPDPEPELPEALALIGPAPETAALPLTLLIAAAETGRWTGHASATSAERIQWPELTAVLPAFSEPHQIQDDPDITEMPGETDKTVLSVPSTGVDALSIIRGRRSAQRMDALTHLDEDSFRRICHRLMPTPGAPPFDALSGPMTRHPVRIHPVFMVHRVDGVDPGLYLLCRDPRQLPKLRQALSGGGGSSALDIAVPAFDWTPLPDIHPALRRLTRLDLKRGASKLFCRQGIGGRGALAVAMLGAFADALNEEGAAGYAALHREAGALGQLLYLEAEASGLRGTGIGCFLDDAVHGVLGVPPGDADGPLPDWQMIYGFTMGGALEDDRLATEPAYAHLQGRE